MALRDYDHIRTALFVKIEVDRYFSGGSFSQETLAFTDHIVEFTYEGVDYLPLGDLVSISSSRSELRTSSDTIDIIISGIGNSRLEDLVKSEFRTSAVEIFRGFFSEDGTLETAITPNPVGRFKGFINSVSLNETWNTETRESSNTVTFECQSYIDILSQKTSGRQTNPRSMKAFFPNDVSFDRVPKIANARYNFGAVR